MPEEQLQSGEERDIKSGGRKKRLKLALGALALLATLSAHLSVAYFLANDAPDDGRGYAQLANNLLEHRVFSLETAAPYAPTLIRLPGYPLFLAAIYSIFGHGNNTAVRLAQALIDTATCVLVALLAWNCVSDERRRRMAACAAFALAALCPFTAIYAATILTESLTTFFAMAMTLAAVYAFKARRSRAAAGCWILTGLLAGAAVLLRPDSGLFAAGIGLTLVLTGLFMRGETENAAPRKFRSRLARTTLNGALFSLAFALVLLPWTIRNERVFHLFQPLAPAHAEMPGEFVPHGYYLWLRTWIDDQRYIEPMLWNLEDKPINIEQLPAYAFDSDDERARVAALLERYNHPPPDEQQPATDAQTATSPGSAATAGSSNSSSTEHKDNGSTEAQDKDGKETKGDKATNGSEKAKSSENANKDENADSNESADSKDDSDQSQDEDDDNQDEENQDEQEVLMTPEIDAGFAQVARERIARSPLRYYAWLPLKRAAALWFDTHSAYYPFGGELFPLKDLDRDVHQQLWLPLFAVLMWLYTLLGLAGAFFLWRTRERASRRWLLLLALMTLPRLAFFSILENPEPRYVVELFAFISVLGGIAIARINPNALFKLIHRLKRKPAATT
jgi:4-amino-4-deoxy-L-arabinose transferase-like glycosyltransferase